MPLERAMKNISFLFCMLSVVYIAFRIVGEWRELQRS